LAKANSALIANLQWCHRAKKVCGLDKDPVLPSLVLALKGSKRIKDLKLDLDDCHPSLTLDLARQL
jgi:hypothetical protein